MLNPLHPFQAGSKNLRARQPNPISDPYPMHCIRRMPLTLLALAFPLLIAACGDNTPRESILIPYPAEATESTPSFSKTSAVKRPNKELKAQKEHGKNGSAAARS